MKREISVARVVLVNLAIIKFYDSAKEIQETYNPPLGLLYLSSSLIMAGHTVKIIDYTKVEYSRKEFIEEVKLFNPTLIGISVYTENVEAAFKFCKGIKKSFPHIKTVLGGPQASLEPGYTVNDHNVDFVIKHEGEASMLELVEAIDSNESVIRLRDVGGIVYYDKNETLIENKKRKDIKDLDLLAFPLRKTSEIQDYGNILNIITSRGCPGNCIYCSATALSGAIYRVRSVEHTLLEIMLIKAMFGEHLKVIYILDDTFTSISSRVFQFINLKKKLKLDFLWRCESRVDVITEEMVKGLEESNCVGVAYGVESGSQYVLDKINKKIDLVNVEYVVDLMYKYGIYTSLNFMLGHYCDTVETMEMTYMFIKKLFNKYGVGIFTTFNTPFPGTWQRTRMDKLGIKLLLTKYSEYSVLSPSIEGENFTVEDQLEVYSKILPIMNGNDFGLR